MTIELITHLVPQYGYLALFFLLWLGIIGMPIPDEVVVMSAGLAASLGIIHPIMAFLVTYAGVISGLSIGYLLGRVIGIPALEYLAQKKDMSRYINKANRLVEDLDSYALVASYFFPVIRHVVPYIVGMTKISYSKYALFSYSTGFIWTLIYFAIGIYFGSNINMFENFLTANKLVFIAIFLFGCVSIMLKKSLFNIIRRRVQE